MVFMARQKNTGQYFKTKSGKGGSKKLFPFCGGRYRRLRAYLAFGIVDGNVKREREYAKNQLCRGGKN